MSKFRRAIYMFRLRNLDTNTVTNFAVQKLHIKQLGLWDYINEARIESRYWRNSFM